MTPPTLKPWAYGPFEVLVHAEMHFREGEDLDRRISMIGFDNAIEVAVTTYLSLNPIQRGNRQYATVDVAKWLQNFHTKVEFFFLECGTRGVTAVSGAAEIVWYHGVRNDQYHVGGATVPQRRELEGVRAAALEVFGVLFEELDVEVMLEEYLAAMTPYPPPPRSETHDRLIDSVYGMVELCGQHEYASELLHSLDPGRYRELALEIGGSEIEPGDEAGGDDVVA
jgi:hypothetical protein